MNLAYINADHGIPLFSGKGAAVHVRDFTRAARRLGYSVRLFTAVAGTATPEWPIPFTVVGGQADDTTAAGIRGLRLNTSTRAALATAHAGTPFDLVYERYSLWSHAGLGFARRQGLPFVLEVNSPLIVEQATYRTLAQPATARRIERYLFSGATRVVVVSDEVGDYVCRHGGAPDRVVVCTNGVDLGLYDSPPSAAPQRGDRFTIGFLGSLKPWHGLDVLIDALADLLTYAPCYHLRIVGDGPERDRVVRTLTARGLDAHATLVGQVAREAVPGELALVDCAVAPYPRLDGFYFSPLKVFEYMAAGRPIVASRIGQIESVLDADTALLVEPGSALDLSQAIRTLHAQPDLGARLGEVARQRAFARHGWGHTVTAALTSLVEDVR